jgi:branched-chain amino acid transport system ATP-binding protein
LALLELRDVEARYGPVQALRGVTLDVAEGELVSVLGANGAGKTTTLRAISGAIQRAGQIQFEGRSLLGKGAADAARLGIAHVPEGRGTMGALTVWENLQLGAYVRHDREIGADLERVFGYFPILRERRKQYAGTLSGGEQQMLAIGRALMARPKLLLLDEPSLGLAPRLVDQILETIRELKRDGLTILLVEQNAGAALAIADRAYVLENGVIAMSGSAAEIRVDQRVREAYLGM